MCFLSRQVFKSANWRISHAHLCYIHFLKISQLSASSHPLYSSCFQTLHPFAGSLTVQCHAAQPLTLIRLLPNPSSLYLSIDYLMSCCPDIHPAWGGVDGWLRRTPKVIIVIPPPFPPAIRRGEYKGGLIVSSRTCLPFSGCGIQLLRGCKARHFEFGNCRMWQSLIITSNLPVHLLAVINPPFTPAHLSTCQLSS
jgi:hypothetical protein